MPRSGDAIGRSGRVLTWLNLVCLDAPLVAISWQWLFARADGIAVTPSATAALFLTAWLIYLGDRFGDSLSIAAGTPLSLRQRFCARHRVAWLLAILGIALADVLVIAQLDRGAIRSGLGVGAMALVYLTVNQRWPGLWRRLPLKEMSIGFLFAAGTRVGLAAGLTNVIWPAWLLFACLCVLNCVSIAVWERALDLAQQRVSIATVFPRGERYLLPMFAVLTLVSLSLAFSQSDARTVPLAVAMSTLLLAGVHLFRNRIEPDVRTALADLVLLTPLAFLGLGLF
ncbi:MAG: hypothetical protein ABI992_10465 [Chthoniobacterales bacterium]